MHGAPSASAFSARSVLDRLSNALTLRSAVNRRAWLMMSSRVQYGCLSLWLLAACSTNTDQPTDHNEQSSSAADGGAPAHADAGAGAGGGATATGDAGDKG